MQIISFIGIDNYLILGREFIPNLNYWYSFGHHGNYQNMNRLLLKLSDKQPDSTFLIKDQRRLTHLKNHLKIEVGQEIKITLQDQGLSMGKIISLSENEIAFKLGAIQPIQQRSLNLFIGISRPPTMKKVIEHGTSMGVTHFHLVGADLSEKSYFDSKIFENENLMTLLELGIEQSGYFCKIPKVLFYKSIDDIMALGKSIFLHPETSQSYFEIDFKNVDEISLAIGPERGWTKNEVEVLAKKGFAPAHLGGSRLRTEIATFTCLGPLGV